MEGPVAMATVAMEEEEPTPPTMANRAIIVLCDVGLLWPVAPVLFCSKVLRRANLYIEIKKDTTMPIPT